MNRHARLSSVLSIGGILEAGTVLTTILDVSDTHMSSTAAAARRYSPLNKAHRGNLGFPGNPESWRILGAKAAVATRICTAWIQMANGTGSGSIQAVRTWL
jgi:hypothetical protein